MQTANRTLTDKVTRADVLASLKAMLEMADVLHRAAQVGEANARRRAQELGFQTHDEAVAWCYGEIDADRALLRKLAAADGEDLGPAPALDARMA